MNKEKLIKALMWLSGFAMSVFLSAISLFAGFNNARKEDDYTLLVLGLVLLPAIFFFAYKGFKLILDSIFEK